MTKRGYLPTAAHCWRGQHKKRDALQCSRAPGAAGPPSRVTAKRQQARSQRCLDSGSSERLQQEGFFIGDQDHPAHLKARGVVEFDTTSGWLFVTQAKQWMGPEMWPTACRLWARSYAVTAWVMFSKQHCAFFFGGCAVWVKYRVKWYRQETLIWTGG